MEEKKIGRPSTYAPTITTILDRRYIEKDKKILHPTELGRIVNSIMKEYFEDIVDLEFTAQMEEKLDEVAEGEKNWKNVVKDFYKPFAENLAVVEKEMDKVVLKDEETDVPCEKCGRMMVIKVGRYGKFKACPGFPECRNIKPIVEKLDVKCPKCGGDILIKKSKRGKKYYICEHNDNSANACDFIAWNGPDKNGVMKPAEIKKTETKKKVSRKKSTENGTSKSTTKSEKAKKASKVSTKKISTKKK